MSEKLEYDLEIALNRANLAEARLGDANEVIDIERNLRRKAETTLVECKGISVRYQNHALDAMDRLADAEALLTDAVYRVVGGEWWTRVHDFLAQKEANDAK